MKIFRNGLVGCGLAASLLSSLHADLAGTPAERRQGYLDRIHEVVTTTAARADLSQPGSGGLAAIATKLVLNEDLDWCSASVIELMKAPTGDMFWTFPTVTVAFLGRDKLSQEARDAIRDAWRTYMPMRGDTENHWAMYYTSLYLMSQLYPDEPGETWYTGNDSARNMAEAREYLVSWIDLTTTKGQGEYDCTHYIGEYVAPMAMLASFAEDPAMRMRGQMMLDYIFADFAIDNLNGLYAGSHARTDDRGVLESWNNLSTVFAWLVFGNTTPPGYSWSVYFAAMGTNYELPEVIYRIANDRTQPYLSHELKRTRHRWRNSDLRNPPVYKTVYMTRDYAVGTSQGGLLQPLQNHTWDLTWAVDDPRGVHNTIYSIHPHYSSEEMQMYFTEMPDWMPDAVVFQGKPSYNKPYKLLGGSKYEQVFQDLDTVIALYDIPEGTKYEHINGFFSKDLSRMEEDPSGWIFAQGGQTYLAYRPLAPYEWREVILLDRNLNEEVTGDKRLYSPHRRNGTILQAASATEFDSWEAFKNAIRKLPLEVKLQPSPSVVFTSLRGHALTCAFGQAPTVNGKPVDYAAEWKLFDNPFMQSEPGSGRLTLTHGKLQRILDFNTVTITDSAVED
ncbi:MAG: hypothetical protein R3F07_18435 [Opitutaceae bacterium]